MKQVIRYQCQYCGKDFRTNDRHCCKYNPKFKNCYTCKHNHGFKEHDYSDYGIDGAYYEDRNVFVDCAKGIEPTKVGEVDIAHAGMVKGFIDCNSYEFCGGKWYENEHHKELKKKAEEDCKNECDIF